MKRRLVSALPPVSGALLLGAALAPAWRAPAPPNLTSAPKVSDPVDVVVAQLHRRFTDTRDVDFGFSRISRPKARLHFGPIMDRNDLLWTGYRKEDGPGNFDPRFVRHGENGYELRAEDDTWIPWENVREQMRPENPTERKAIGALLEAKREIAIYTFGAFESGHAERTRGPAYLRQKGPLAPDADAMKAAAETAWRGGRPLMPGFRLRAERVFAKASCVKCHDGMRDVEEGAPKPRGYRAGDPLGLILIAEKE